MERRQPVRAPVLGMAHQRRSCRSGDKTLAGKASSYNPACVFHPGSPTGCQRQKILQSAEVRLQEHRKSRAGQRMDDDLGRQGGIMEKIMDQIFIPVKL